jgi:hypothetical protein
MPKRAVNVQISLDSEGGLYANLAGPRDAKEKGNRTRNKTPLNFEK